jgi:hypothetical protein
MSVPLAAGATLYGCGRPPTTLRFRRKRRGQIMLRTQNTTSRSAGAVVGCAGDSDQELAWLGLAYSAPTVSTGTRYKSQTVIGHRIVKEHHGPRPEKNSPRCSHARETGRATADKKAISTSTLSRLPGHYKVPPAFTPRPFYRLVTFLSPSAPPNVSRVPLHSMEVCFTFAALNYPSFLGGRPRVHAKKSS